MTGLDAATWQVWHDQRLNTRARLHGRIASGDYRAAEEEIAALIVRTSCRWFDPVLVEDFTTPVQVFAEHLRGWIADAHRAGATALAVYLERGLGNPDLWSCSPTGLSDSVYPFSTSSLPELQSAPEPSPWRGHADWWPPDGILIEGFKDYIVADVAHPVPWGTRADEELAGNLAEMMVGLKYLRFVDAAVRACPSTVPMWIIAEDHDSYWIPRGAFRAGSSEG